MRRYLESFMNSFQSDDDEDSMVVTVFLLLLTIVFILVCFYCSMKRHHQVMQQYRQEKRKWEQNLEVAKKEVKDNTAPERVMASMQGGPATSGEYNACLRYQCQGNLKFIYDLRFQHSDDAADGNYYKILGKGEPLSGEPVHCSYIREGVYNPRSGYAYWVESTSYACEEYTTAQWVRMDVLVRGHFQGDGSFQGTFEGVALYEPPMYSEAEGSPRVLLKQGDFSMFEPQNSGTQ